MQIALCCINSKYVHSSLAPWYLAAAMEGVETCEVSVVEGTINQSVEEIAQKILHDPPEVAAFCCYIWNIDMVHQVIRSLKAQRPGLTVVLGGPEVTFRPAEDPFPMAGSVLCALRRRGAELSGADAGPGGKAGAGRHSWPGVQG